MASLTHLADLWIGRRAAPDAAALAAVEGRTPAVVVTGASRGIGRALALRFAQAGHDVAMIARGREALDEAAQAVARATGAKTVALSLDITQATAPHDLDRALEAAGLYADVLVNNAGMGLAGLFAERELHDVERLLALNVSAATRLMRHVLQGMLARGRGGVVNVASLGGLVPGPNQAVYYASKAYLLSLTEAVAYETRGRGVRIMAVAPGPVKTTFHRAMQAESALYRRLGLAHSTDTIARSAYRGYVLGRTVVVPGVFPTLAAVGLRVLPHLISVPLVGALLAPWSRR